MSNEILKDGMVEEAITLGGEITQINPNSLKSAMEDQINRGGEKKFEVEKRGGNYIAIDESGSKYQKNKETGEWKKIEDGQKDD